MKRILTFVMVILAAGGVRAGQIPVASADETALIQLTTDLANAVVRRDSARIEAVLADDFAFTHSTGVVFDKRKEIAEIGASDAHWTSVTVDNTRVRFYGDVGIVTGSQTFKGAARGMVEGTRLFTHIFVKRDGRWQLVGGQFTLLPEIKKPIS